MFPGVAGTNKTEWECGGKHLKCFGEAVNGADRAVLNKYQQCDH